MAEATQLTFEFDLKFCESQSDFHVLTDLIALLLVGRLLRIDRQGIKHQHQLDQVDLGGLRPPRGEKYLMVVLGC